MKARLLDLRGRPDRANRMWRALVVPRAELEEAAARLMDGEAGEGGRRDCAILHPDAPPEIGGFAPGIEVTLSVLRAGEATEAFRHNAASVTICLAGEGEALVAGRRMPLARFDVVATPAMAAQRLRAAPGSHLTLLTYSNAPLLRRLEVYHREPLDTEAAATPRPPALPRGPRAKDRAPVVAIDEEGAQLMPYEHLVDPDAVESRPLLWRYTDVERHFGVIRGLPLTYSGRRLYCLYNPSTEKRNGTTHCFFATLASSPPGVVHTAHRHCSAAINYYLHGSGNSIVEGERLEFEAGDLQLSAPGWAVHRHASGPEGMSTFTVQDHPLHIGMDSLIWQERLDGPIRSLGSEAGFETNLAELRA